MKTLLTLLLLITSWMVSANEYLSYVTIDPCRIVDTRKNMGAIEAEHFLNFKAWGSEGELAWQGGNGCPNPMAGVKPKAVSAYVLVVPDKGTAGVATAYPSDKLPPPVGAGSTVNFGQGRVTGNTTNITLCEEGFCPADGEFAVLARSTGFNLVVDVQGYFYPAPAGSTGPAGPQGPAGSIGPVGPTGSTGPQGSVGTQGISGLPGPAGPTGLPGSTGPVGAQGVSGPTGPQGPAGAQGPCPINSQTRWVDNGDETICDNQTGLMWEKKLPALNDGTGNCDPNITPRQEYYHCVNNTYSWSSYSIDDWPSVFNGTALTFLRTTNNIWTLDPDIKCFANHCDWRLPRLAELKEILNDTYPYIDPVFGPAPDYAIYGGEYWTSTTDYFGPPFTPGFNLPWVINFSDGSIGHPEDQNSYHLVRLVREAR